MPLKTNNKASTSNQRQTRRRKREKIWLKANGWQSWEALHTALMNDLLHLTPSAMDALHLLDDIKIPRTKKQK